MDHQTALRTDKKEQKRHGAASFPVACYLGDYKTIHVPWHWHDEMEVLVVEQGSGFVEISSAKYTVPAGSGCFINAGVLHALKRWRILT